MKTPTVTPRGWQQDALSIAIQNLTHTQGACPGAGKTILSGLWAWHMLHQGNVDFILAVVPTTALKGDAVAGFLGDWDKCGVELTTCLRDGQSKPADFDGAVVTYQQLPNLLSTLDTWVRGTTTKLGFVFDEIHHASDENTWGAAVNQCHLIAERVLAMTGTPFRSDQRPIQFLNYDADGIAVMDHWYGYREAVRDDVCREVQFFADDGVAEYILDGDREEVRVSECTSEQEGPVSGVIYRKGAEMLERIIQKGDDALDQYRITDPDAGGIIICRPGCDQNEDKHLFQVAEAVRKITGEMPEVITSSDKDANAKIERFRAGDSKWIVSVRKISEGVDVKRLRVLVLASRPSTELLFRQIVGRVCRNDSPPSARESQDASVFLARFPTLKEWADSLETEATGGLRDKQERAPSDKSGSSSSFIPISDSHEDGGVITTLGTEYSANEVLYAESLRRQSPELAKISVTTIAEITRLQGIKPPEICQDVPKQVQKMALRKRINQLVRRLAYKLDPDEPKFGPVWQAVHRRCGVTDLNDLMDNHTIEKAEQVRDLLVELFTQEGDVA